MLSALLSLILTAASQPPVIQGWRLERRRHSCFIEAVSDRETYLKIEHDPYQNLFYMSVSARVWTDIVDRQAYRIGLQGDGDRHPRVEAAGVGVRDEDSPRSVVLFTLPRKNRYSVGVTMIDQFRHTSSLRLDLDQANPIVIDAVGLRAAIPMLTNCTGKIRLSRVSPP